MSSNLTTQAKELGEEFGRLVKRVPCLGWKREVGLFSGKVYDGDEGGRDEQDKKRA